MPANTTEKITVKKEWILNAPDSLDYRTQNLVTPVKNQGSCGSCYVFSAIGNIEGQYAKKYGQLVSLSEQQGLDCGTNGCKGGWPVETMNVLAQQGGCEREESYPYQNARSRCRTDTRKIVVRVSGGQEISTPTEEELKAAVAQYGPLAAGLHMPMDDSRHYHGGVMSPRNCLSDGAYLNHAILIVGYGTDPSGKDYWLIKNSWGTAWGEQGYFRLERGKRLCKIGTQGTGNAAIA